MVGLKANLWEVTVKHARMCEIDKPICYYHSFQLKIGVVFNIIEGMLMGIISGYNYFTVEELSEKDKAYFFSSLLFHTSLICFFSFCFL